MRAVLVLLLLLPGLSLAQDGGPVVVQKNGLRLELTPRSPDQMASFYEARGFPPDMIAVIRKQCYITVGIQNDTQEKRWLDLSKWRFTAGGSVLPFKNRDAWAREWRRFGAPKSKRATFHWTLLPPVLDYLPGEHEGGNVLLPFTRQPISLDAVFDTGDDRRGPPLHIHVEGIYCAEDADREDAEK